MPITDPAFFELRFTADLNISDIGKFAPTGPNSRQWYSSPNGVSGFTFAGDADSQSPVLTSRTAAQGAADSFQLKVYVNPADVPRIASAHLLVTFGAQRRKATPVASPFRDQSNDIIAALGIGVTPVFDASDSSYSIRTFAVGVAQRFRPINGDPLSFEFNVMARFLLTDGHVRDYGHDPEMRVDIGTGTKKPKPAAKPAAKKVPVKKVIRKKAEMRVDIGVGKSAKPA